jgi:spermidine/putrescine ABC transporter ATP-binding subunit
VTAAPTAASTSTTREHIGSKLSLEGLTFAYGERPAVEDLSLSVRAGEFVSLLGPSGCGKTTALRIVAGLLRPAHGRVLLDGRDITRLAPEKRPLGMVFQHLALFPHLSVEENVAFSLKLQRRDRRAIRKRVQEMLKLVGLGWAGSRSVHQLSGGQQQRVALARSLVSEPEVLLLDEPLGALDLQIRKEMQAELKSLQRRVGITFIFVTHDQTEAMAMSDRIVLMRDGRIVQDAPPQEVYSHPADAFVAGFVGETNLLTGTVQSDSAGVLVITVGDDVLVLPGHSGYRRDQRVAVSIRPEHLSLAGVGGESVLEGRVSSQTFLGHEVLLEIETAVAVLRVRRTVDEPNDLEVIGDAVHLAYDPRRVHVFPLDGYAP